MLKLALFAVLVAVAAAGVIEHDRCGGIGTFKQLRIDGCQGLLCNMIAGTPYECEGDLVPSSASPSLALKVTAYYMGFPVSIIDAVLPGSSVQPGVQYTIRFTIVPNDLLAGEYLPIDAQIYHTDAQKLEEICVTFHVRVAARLY